jgi:hypothetical protein
LNALVLESPALLLSHQGRHVPFGTNFYFKNNRSRFDHI